MSLALRVVTPRHVGQGRRLLGVDMSEQRPFHTGAIMTRTSSTNVSVVCHAWADHVGMGEATDVLVVEVVSAIVIKVRL